jgi:hypothetical protein
LEVFKDISGFGWIVNRRLQNNHVCLVVIFEQGHRNAKLMAVTFSVTGHEERDGAYFPLVCVSKGADPDELRMEK